MNGTWLDRNRHILFGVLLLMAIGGGTLFYLQQPVPTPIEIAPATAQFTPTPAPTPTPPPAFTATPAPVRVYVTGAVAQADVYFLPAGSIIKDAVQAAGGFTDQADAARINLALELKDQQQIHVPALAEESPPPPVQGGVEPVAVLTVSGDSPSSPAVININTASLEELDSLPGIGPAIGQRIIDFRQNVGRFQSIDELGQVSGIGPATLTKIKDKITVD